MCRQIVDAVLAELCWLAKHNFGQNFLNISKLTWSLFQHMSPRNQVWDKHGVDFNNTNSQDADFGRFGSYFQ
jgi:hypothetical protein